jgi:pantothenate kinase type III
VDLLVEAGNTRCKARLGDGLAVRAADPAELPWSGAARVVLLPTAAAAARAVADEARRRGLPVLTVGHDLMLPDLGQYPGMGLDRQVAALAVAAPVVVVDAGTACTLTAWEMRPPVRPLGGGIPGALRELLHQDAGRPRLLGGLILPGIRACAAGLHALAPALPEVAPGGDDPCVRTPGEAIANGLAIGWPGMIGAALARLRAVTGISTVVATGGDADRLADAGVLARSWIRPDLVLDGLATLTTAPETRNPKPETR